ncbi:MAG: matrixin family metalloprotease, partial [Candidatus Obscuribacterales bacterium]|nr:matrixin family metalloprotease [Candidatus Obscuribacterales bacterium]
QGMMPPTQGMMPPTQGMMPPTQGMMPPTQGMMPPTQGMMPPSQGMMPPTQGMMPPSQGMMPPSQGSPGSSYRTNSSDGLGLNSKDRANVDLDSLVRAIPVKTGAGDYFANINKFAGQSVARWTSFPVLVHLPQGSPAPWQKALDDAVSAWGHYIPIRVASPAESADIELAWINHLAPRSLGQTNLEVFNGRMRVTVYLLRPSYYLVGTSEKSLQRVAEHELGHAIGLFGHSSDAADLMYPLENLSAKNAIKGSGITARDLNTLRKIYEASPLPAGFQSPQPMGWSLKSAD